MKKIIYWLILVAGGFLVYHIADVYLMLAFIGLWLAFGVTLLKLHLSDALRLWGFVIFYMAIMLGGGVILARKWSEFAAGVWIFICIILLFVFQNKIKRLIPMLYIAEKFEEIIKEKSKEF